MPKAIIAGCGVAGLTAALAARQAGYQVVVFDPAPHACYYTSSRNAAIARSYEADPALSRVARTGVITLQQYPALYQPCGLLIRPLERDYNNQPTITGLEPQPGSYRLPDGQVFSGEFVAQNGIIGIAELTRHLVGECQRQGITLHFGHRVHIQNIRGGYICQIAIEPVQEFLNNHSTIAMEIHNSDLIINAAGSWARELGQQAGSDIPIIPHKRHLYRMLPPAGKKLPADLPVLWDEQNDFYLRPDREAILATPGDQTPTTAADYTPDEKMAHTMRAIFRHHLPWFADFTIETAHACLRSFPRDNRPVLGFDPKVQNLFWNAGWGGHGMTIALGMIAEISETLSQGFRRETELDNPFTPARFF